MAVLMTRDGLAFRIQGQNVAKGELMIGDVSRPEGEAAAAWAGAMPADAMGIRAEALERLRPLRQVAALVASRFTEALTLADAASAAGLETTYFCRIFKQTVGVGFPAYLQRVRLEAAAHMLATSDHSVLEVANRCGFGSVRSMERASRRWLGCSPSDLRGRPGCQEM